MDFILGYVFSVLCLEEAKKLGKGLAITSNGVKRFHSR